MCAFGQLGYMPKLPRHGKLTDRSTMGHYMGMCDMRYVTTQLPNGHNTHCIAANFHQIHAITDPTRAYYMAFPTHDQRMRKVSVTIYTYPAAVLYIFKPVDSLRP